MERGFSLIMALVRRVRCKVSRMISHRNHVFTLELSPERKIPTFQPGQFLQLALNEYKPGDFWPESRAFSIASSPSQQDFLRISYAVKGYFTSRMEKEIKEGGTVWVKLPYGEFVVNHNADIALFAGGTGITAFSAFLEELSPEGDQDIFLSYGAQSYDLLIYYDAVAKVAASVPHFHPVLFIESKPEGRIPSDIPINIGRLSVANVWSSIPDPLKMIYYLSGPPQMIQDLSDDLRSRKVNEGSIRIDDWE